MSNIRHVNMVLTFKYICHRKMDGWMEHSSLHGLGVVLGWGSGVTGASSLLTTSTEGADEEHILAKYTDHIIQGVCVTT